MGIRRSQCQPAVVTDRIRRGPPSLRTRRGVAALLKASRGQVVFDRLEKGCTPTMTLGTDMPSGRAILFVGVVDEDGGNRVDAIAEFYWFESSVERGDFTSWC